MGIREILQALSGGLIKQVGKILDDTTLSKEERMVAENKLSETIFNQTLQYETELTNRHDADMKSDNWLSKSIRPLTLAFTVVLITALAFTDGNIKEFEIKEHYITVIEGWGSLAFMFYFGSRGVEKVFDIIRKPK